MQRFGFRVRKGLCVINVLSLLCSPFLLSLRATAQTPSESRGKPNPEFQKKLFSDPKLNAITKLDNHIQLQYEIIARQLTLLRDEVRPGERLVFLESPQSIYTTDDKADNKVAQVYRQVDGYYWYDAVAELNQAIEIAGRNAASISNQDNTVLTMTEAICRRENIDDLCRGNDQACSRRREQCRRYDEYNYLAKKSGKSDQKKN